MTRAAIWNDANCLAARSARPTFFNVNVGIDLDVFNIHYAQQIYRGGPPNSFSEYEPRIRLEETALPDGVDLYSASPQFLPFDQNLKFYFPTANDQSVPDERFTSGMIGLSTYSISGRSLVVHDTHTITSSFSAATQQRIPIVVSEGRHRPSHRMRGVCDDGASFSLLGAPVDFAPFVDAIGSFFAMKTTHLPTAVMLVPKVAGNLTLSGVYIAFRPLINATSHRPDGGAPINYAAARLPNPSSGTPLINMVEIGTFSGVQFTAQRQLIVASGVLSFDAGLARAQLGAESGTELACVVRTSQYGSYNQAIAFPYVPPSDDHCLCGYLSGDEPASLVAAIWNQNYRFRAFITTGRKGFNAGECPAFQYAALDHGKVIRVPFYAGAPRSNNWQYGPEYHSTWKNYSPQWATWQHSQFPYTMHKTGALTVDGSVVPLEEMNGQRQLNTPLYDLIDTNDENFLTVEHYPTNIVTAKAARVQATAAGSHFEDAEMTIGKPRDDGKMVFNGKVINGISLEFVPYARQQEFGLNSIYSGIASAQLPSPTPAADHPFSYPTANSSAFLSSAIWWRHRQTSNLPANGIGPGFPTINAVYSGEWCQIGPTLSDAKAISSFSPFASVSNATEIDAHLFGACLVTTENANNTPGYLHSFSAPLASVSGTIDQWKLNGFNGQPWRDGRYALAGQYMNGIMPAPLTGSYELTRFTIGGVQTAGNMFRYSGVGKWSLDRTITYNVYPKVTTIDNSYELVGDSDFFPGKQVYRIADSRSARYATVPITERWKMRADCVELYCNLGATLQQSGSYQADPASPPYDYAAQRNWVKQTFLKHDQPRGRLSETVVYVDGQEPSPVLTMTLRYRTAMRAELTCSVDTSDLPEYPHSMTNSESQVIGGTVAGLGGSGTVSGANQTVESHHGFQGVSFTFNKEQTAQLMNGEEVLAMQWQKETNPQRPVFADTGGIFLHAFKVRLDLSEA